MGKYGRLQAFHESQVFKESHGATRLVSAIYTDILTGQQNHCTFSALSKNNIFLPLIINSAKAKHVAILILTGNSNSFVIPVLLLKSVHSFVTVAVAAVRSLNKMAVKYVFGCDAAHISGRYKLSTIVVAFLLAKYTLFLSVLFQIGIKLCTKCSIMPC